MSGQRGRFLTKRTVTDDEEHAHGPEVTAIHLGLCLDDYTSSERNACFGSKKEKFLARLKRRQAVEEYQQRAVLIAEVDATYQAAARLAHDACSNPTLEFPTGSYKHDDDNGNHGLLVDILYHPHKYAEPWDVWCREAKGARGFEREIATCPDDHVIDCCISSTNCSNSAKAPGVIKSSHSDVAPGVINNSSKDDDGRMTMPSAAQTRAVVASMSQKGAAPVLIAEKYSHLCMSWRIYGRLQGHADAMVVAK